MSVLKAQKKLCHVIASLDAHAPLDEVSKALDPLLTGWQEVDATDEVVDENDGVTPLMVACDKAQEGCIEYMCKANPSVEVILGHPLGESSLSKNSAMHFAARSGCIPAIHQLSHMLGGRNGDVRKLASQRNENLDTPIMMAAVGGHVAFLRHLMHALLQQEETTDEVKRLFELENDSECTALSLSCGYGHVELTDFLVQEIGVTVTHNHVQECKTILKVMDGELKRSACADELRDRRKDVHRCLVTLQIQLAKTAQAAMDQLLAEEDAKETKRKKNRKKKCKRKSKSVSEVREGSQDNHALVRASDVHDDSERDTSKEESVYFIGNQRTTKQKGDSDVPDCDAADQGVPPENKIALQQGNVPPHKAGRNATDYDLDVESVMEALCLDNTMLLLSPRSMALNLSPSQLDAIGAILRNQVGAVEQAREIQFRLLRPSPY